MSSSLYLLLFDQTGHTSKFSSIEVSHHHLTALLLQTDFIYVFKPTDIKIQPLLILMKGRSQTTSAALIPNFSFFCFWLHGMRDLRSPPGVKPVVPEVWVLTTGPLQQCPQTARGLHITDEEERPDPLNTSQSQEGNWWQRGRPERVRTHCPISCFYSFWPSSA